MSKETLIVSTSGGRTSMLMAIWLKRTKSHIYNLVFVFANTGQEHEETLNFIKRVDEKWRLGIVWLEAVTHYGERKGCTFREVNYYSASREGEPFESMIIKYGIPNKAYPHCNRELKLNPMMKWRKEFYPDAKFAVGIRSDEIDRMSIKADKDRVIYPFISMHPTTKSDVLHWWRAYPEIDLRIPEHHGNCKWCWKKSDRKLMTIALDNPEFFDFPKIMEEEYATHGANDDERVFFRGKSSANELIARAHTEDFKKFNDPHDYSYQLDTSNGCSESCEVFADNLEV